MSGEQAYWNHSFVSRWLINEWRMPVCSDDVWHSLVQMIANSGNQELQKHAAGTFAEMLYQGKRNEMLIKVAAYVLGEYGTLLSEDPRHYFQALTDQIPVVEVETKSIMVTSFAKIATKTSDMQFKRVRHQITN